MELALLKAYTDILREEIVPATGCAEPISIAYCAAKAHEVLGMQPTAVTVSVNENTLKNVSNVVVPNTNGLKGIRAAVAAGIVCGDSEKGMQVLRNVTSEKRAAVAHFMEAIHIDVSCAETDCQLYISVTLYARTSYSRVVIANSHTNIVEIMRNGEAILKRPFVIQNEERQTERSCLNFHDIFDYANTIDLSTVKDQIDLQISCNTAICRFGLTNDCGANIGRILLKENASDIKTIAQAYAAAGNDARMSGCELPVAILCGSGSLGIAATVPIVCYAEHFHIHDERLYRALLISDLLTVYQKTETNKLSSYCDAVHAGCAAGAGISYLLGGDESAVAHTLINSVTLGSGMLCDGAKSSCAAKIAAAVETGILGYRMYLYDREAHRERETEEKNIDDTIRSFLKKTSEGILD